MTPLSDHTLARLHTGLQEPDLAGTRYSLLHYLARGGMGSVWLAQDTMLQRRIALKVLDLVPPTDDFATRLLQEARILAGLEHPGIVPVHDVGTLPDGRVFYCMKFVEGQTLLHHAAGKSLPERLRLLERIAEPLSFAHARGVIHRDLKPDNIMIGAFGEVLVMDWGLAKIASPVPVASPPTANEIDRPILSTVEVSAVTGQGGVLGTVGYMSPEQSRGDSQVDHRSDIFSLGAILWFLSAGSPPAIPLGSGAGMPRPLRAICQKAMADDPAGRYQSAGEMIDDIEHYLQGLPVSAYPENVFERVGRIYSRHSTAILLIFAYLLMRFLFSFFQRR